MVAVNTDSDPNYRARRQFSFVLFLLAPSGPTIPYEKKKVNPAMGPQANKKIKRESLFYTLSCGLSVLVLFRKIYSHESPQS